MISLPQEHLVVEELQQEDAKLILDISPSSIIILYAINLNE
jgi:hypothetical protein